jgi:hypothetical protein
VPIVLAVVVIVAFEVLWLRGEVDMFRSHVYTGWKDRQVWRGALSYLIMA